MYADLLVAELVLEVYFRKRGDRGVLCPPDVGDVECLGTVTAAAAAYREDAHDEQKSQERRPHNPICVLRGDPSVRGDYENLSRHVYCIVLYSPLKLLDRLQSSKEGG